MADIVNPLTPSAPSPVERKKDLYHHVSFKELYAYNEAIMEVIQMKTKTPFHRMIENGVNYWRAVAEKFPLTGDLRLQVSGPGYFTWIENLDCDQSTDPNFDYELHFAVLELYDPYACFFTDVEAKYHLLRQYTDLGLYPMVSIPDTTDDIIGMVEKFGHYRPTGTQGTIVDVMKYDNRLFATVMWAPSYTDEYKNAMYGSSSGILTMNGGIETPEVWKSKVGDFVGENVVPIFQYQPDRIGLQRLANSVRFQELVNDAVTMDHVHLDYIDFLVKKVKALSDDLVRTGGVSETETVVTHDEVLEAALKENDYEVPIEKVEESEWAKRMRLLDEVSEDFDYDSIADAVMDTAFNINEDIT